MSCILCLEQQDFAASQHIYVNVGEGKLFDINNIIQKYLWLDENDLIKADLAICRLCWESLYAFHTFYLRIKQAHDHLNAVQTTELTTDFIEDVKYIKIETDKIDEAPPRRSTRLIRAVCKFEPEGKPDINAKKRRRRQNAEENESADLSGEPESLLVQVDNNIVASQISTPKKRGRPPKQLINDDEVPLCHIAEVLLEEKPDLNIKSELDDISVYNTNEEQDNFTYDNEVKTVGDDKDVLLIAEHYTESIKELSPLSINSEHKLQARVSRSLNQRRSVHNEKALISRQFDDFIRDNFNLSCCVCHCVLADFAELKSHFRAQHQLRGYVQCCGKKLLKRGVLVDHIRTHQDPHYFKCEQCGKIMADRRCLEMHLKGHDKREKVHQCDVCSKSFHRRSVFMRHVLLHVPDDQKNIPCPQCQKTFASNCLMRQHLKLVHLNVYAKICDICGKSIRGREALKRHQEEHAGITRAPIQCEQCGITLTNKYGLTRHMKVMHSEENLKPQICPICEKVSPTLSAHQRHIKYMHNMQRKHACPMCDKAFKRGTDLKEHMTTHTGEVLYTCPHCPKTFNSNANMHSHRKKAHRQEWEEKRKQKYQLAAAAAITKEEPLIDVNQE